MYVSAPFERRLKKIERRHYRLSFGSVRKVTSSGLVEARPRLYNPRFPFKGLFFVLLACFAFKCYLLVDLGSGQYTQRVETLRSGSLVEQAGAWIMQVDPATAIVAQSANKFLR